jgi:hypothetical protein
MVRARARALVMDIAEDPLNRIGSRTGRRSPEQRKTRMAGQPLLDGVGFMPTGVIYDNRDARRRWRWVGGGSQRQEVTKQPIVHARAEAIEQFASVERQRPSQIMLRVRAWQHPSCPNLGQQMHSEFIRNDHHLMRLQVFVLEPKTGQPLNPMWIIIFEMSIGVNIQCITGVPHWANIMWSYLDGMVFPKALP